MTAFFSSNKSYPLTQKPLTSPDNKLTYEDIFKLQNTIRSILRDLDSELEGYVKEAPEDGKTYGRKDGDWTEVTGGGGGTSTAFNLYITGTRAGVSNDYRGYTVFLLLSSGALLSTSNKWKFSMWLQASAAFTVGPMKILKTPVGATNVVSSSDITLGGSLLPVITPPSSSIFRIDTDTITTPMDGANDVWLAIYFPSSNAVTNNIGTMENSSYVKGNFILGDRTGTTNISVGPVNPYLVSNVQQVP